MLAAIHERDQKGEALQKAIAAERRATEARQEVLQFASRITQANLLLTNGQMHAEERLWSTALNEFTRATELQPSYYLPWVVRGQFYARLNIWAEAAEDYERALKLGAPVDEPQWTGVLTLFRVMGKQSAFEQLQVKYLDMRKEHNSKPKWNVLRSVVVLPTEIEDVALAQMAQNWLEQNGPPPRRPGEDLIHGRPNGGRPPRDFHNGNDRAERLPPFECEYICGVAFLRTGRDPEAVRWLRSAAAAREWPARDMVDAPLAIALQRLEKTPEAEEVLGKSDRQIQVWMKEASDPDSDDRKFPWFYLTEALVLHRDATHELRGIWIDNQPKIEMLRAAGIAKLTSTTE